MEVLPNIAEGCNIFEGRILGNGGRIPILGRAIAAIKIPFGVIVLTTTIAIFIFGAPIACCKGKYRLFSLYASHYAEQGLRSIFGGMIEAIPIIGLFISFCRFSNQAKKNSPVPGMFCPFRHSVRVCPSHGLSMHLRVKSVQE